jgi:hypothetical protein
MPEYRIRRGIYRPVGRQRRCYQRHSNVPGQQTPYEVVDVTLEAADAMKRIDRSRQHGDAR